MSYHVGSKIDRNNGNGLLFYIYFMSTKIIVRRIEKNFSSFVLDAYTGLEEAIRLGDLLREFASEVNCPNGHTRSGVSSIFILVDDEESISIDHGKLCCIHYLRDICDAAKISHSMKKDLR